MNFQTDRTDEIRAAVVQARRYGWAAQLDYAVKLMEIPDPDLAQAIVMTVASEIRP